MNLRENIRRILREELLNTSVYVRRRYACMNEYVTKLENGQETIPINYNSYFSGWDDYQIILTAYIRAKCGDEGYYNRTLHSNIMDVFGNRLYKWYKDNIDK